VTPSARTKHLLTSQNWTVGTVQRFVPQAKRFFDLYGFIDLCCIHKIHGFLAVQVTGGNNGSARIKKIINNASAYLWLQAGGKIEVHDWRYLKKLKKWDVAINKIEKNDFPEKIRKGEYIDEQFIKNKKK
tara:strand:- start:3689 stop:4078 length:390 start_codon:yes stop_codon:yes gene_type:complete